MLGNAKTARLTYTYDAASQAANTSSEVTISAPNLGITQGCIALIVPRASVAMIFPPARCGTDQIFLKQTNPTAGAVDLGSATYDIIIIYPTGESSGALT